MMFRRIRRSSLALFPALALVVLLEPKQSYFEPIQLVLSALRNPVVVESKLEWHWDSKLNIVFASLPP
jgi:hypothetical protein